MAVPSCHHGMMLMVEVDDNGAGVRAVILLTSALRVSKAAVLWHREPDNLQNPFAAALSDCFSKISLANLECSSAPSSTLLRRGASGGVAMA
jgi:hypothetical protein